MAAQQIAVPSLRDRIVAFGRALTAAEAANLFGVSEAMIHKQARIGNIPSFRIGTSVRFDPKALIDWFERQ